MQTLKIDILKGNNTRKLSTVLISQYRLSRSFSSIQDALLSFFEARKMSGDWHRLASHDVRVHVIAHTCSCGIARSLTRAFKLRLNMPAVLKWGWLLELKQRSTTECSSRRRGRDRPLIFSLVTFFAKLSRSGSCHVSRHVYYRTACSNFL